MLDAVGVTDLIATDEDEYVRIAIDLATDRDRLLRLREELRGRLQASPLMDYTGVAKKTDPEEIKLVRKLDYRIMVCIICQLTATSI